ncbi:MAG: nucleotidyltransferase family protein [Gammaproteobacteria bacterium]
MVERLFCAVVLAADRHRNDPVAKAAGVACKAMAKIQGKPMLLRVLAALQSSHEIGRITLSGPARETVQQTPELRGKIAAGELGWVAPQGSPSASVDAFLNTLGDNDPVLIATADHAFLKAHIVSDFVRQARAGEYDAVVALVSFDRVKSAYPKLRKTVFKFKDSAYCGCNLFAFPTVQGRCAAAFWRHVENQRKSPLRTIRVIGWSAVIRYVLGRLTLTDALQALSLRMGIRVGAILLPYPEAAVDVDSAEDWFQVLELANGNEQT